MRCSANHLAPTIFWLPKGHAESVTLQSMLRYWHIFWRNTCRVYWAPGGFSEQHNNQHNTTWAYTQQQHLDKTRGLREVFVPSGPYKIGTRQITYFVTKPTKIAAAASTNKEFKIILKCFTQRLRLLMFRHWKNIVFCKVTVQKIANLSNHTMQQ